VTRAILIHGYVQIYLGEIILNLNTRFTLSPAQRNLSSIEGRKVVSVIETAGEIHILFDNSSALRIDMDKTFWIGPEALELHSPGCPTVIWN
jgi:hypothetical protein